MDAETRSPRSKKLASVVWALLIFGLGGSLFYLVQSGRLAAGDPLCSVCKRPLHPAQKFMVASEDGKEHLSCCPRCGLRFAIENKARPIRATDFNNGKWIPAESAYYLEGSDIMECCNSSSMRSDDGMLCEMHYDRCMPSLVAFSDRAAAESFQHRHGGRIISLAMGLHSVSQQMGQTAPEIIK
jgi:hypothetical protein